MNVVRITRLIMTTHNILYKIRKATRRVKKKLKCKEASEKYAKVGLYINTKNTEDLSTDYNKLYKLHFSVTFLS